MTARAYTFAWTPLPTADTAATYRLSVALGDTAAGSVDFRIVLPGFQPPPQDSSRYVAVSPRGALDVSFQIFLPPEPLTVLLQPGVHGSLAPGTTWHTHGESLAYAFDADSGFTHVLVTVDQNYVGARGKLVMNRPHVLVASADPVVTIDQRDAWIVQEGRALLRSSTPVTAAQDLLTGIAEITDTTDLRDRLTRVERVLVTADPAVMHALDQALAGHAFTVGAGTGRNDPAAPPPPPPTGGGTLTARLAPLGSVRLARPAPVTTTGSGGAGVAAVASPRASVAVPVATATRSRYEPVTIAYVNGVLTTPFGALFNAAEVARMSLAAPWGARVPYDVRLIYNSTATRSRSDPQGSCLLELASRSEGLGVNSLPLYMQQCMQASGKSSTIESVLGGMADFAEAGGQLGSILTGTGLVHAADADSLAAITRRWTAAGRHVVFVPHSQGNLMVQQGVDILRRQGRFQPASDSSCIGAVSLAAPTSLNWPISSRHLIGIVNANDPILALRLNQFQQIQIPAAAGEDTELSLWQKLTTIRGITGALRIKFTMQSHDLVRGYLRSEPILTRVKESLVHSYRSCALGDVAISPSPLVLTTGESGTVSVVLTDLNGDSLDGSRGLNWTADADIDWQRAVTMTANGRFLANYVGGTGVRAATSTMVALGGVRVDPAPLTVAVRETLSARWMLIQGMVSGPPSTGPEPPIPTPVFTDTWDGDDCIGKREFPLPYDRVGQFSKVCKGEYMVTTGAVPNARKYEAHFFSIYHTDRLFSLAGPAPSILGIIEGPPVELTNIPGPAVLDRVNVTAWDSAGHLLASGPGCTHGCLGWADFSH